MIILFPVKIRQIKQYFELKYLEGFCRFFPQTLVISFTAKISKQKKTHKHKFSIMHAYYSLDMNTIGNQKCVSASDIYILVDL